MCHLFLKMKIRKVLSLKLICVHLPAKAKTDKLYIDRGSRSGRRECPHRSCLPSFSFPFLSFSPTPPAPPHTPPHLSLPTTCMTYRVQQGLQLREGLLNLATVAGCPHIPQASQIPLRSPQHCGQGKGHVPTGTSTLRPMPCRHFLTPQACACRFPGTK